MMMPRCALLLTHACLLALLFCCGLTFSVLPGWAAATADPWSGPTATILHHQLTVDLTPEGHRLRATDLLTVRALAPDVRELAFSVNAALRVSQVIEISEPEPPRGIHGERMEQPRGFAQEFKSVALETEQRKDPKTGEQVVVVKFPMPLAQGETRLIEWEYQGEINEPPREPRHLRFVTPSETGGHIGSEGVYLSGETHWYPDLPGSLATFDVHVTLPESWEAITHGKKTSHGLAPSDPPARVVSDWHVAEKSEALTLVANRFVIKTRDWTAADGQRVQVQTYLFSEDAALADEYLEASARYLEAYTKLLGPYPFPKFAVVENFFASGLGMPSFTLLGSGVIKRHYVQPYALGHEIVHSWIGNWVLNDPKAGNWVEGLTTYLANYYYGELTGKLDQAREERRLMLLGYAVHVWPREDYAVAQFTRKTDQKDNAIGYQKAAMIFHMLRRWIGEEAFWKGVRRLVTDHGGAYATWSDLERVFTREAGQDLRWFFAQWVEQAGAPRFRLEHVVVKEEQLEHRAEATIVQDGVLYRLRVPVRVMLDSGQADGSVELDRGEQTITMTVHEPPLSLSLDPDFEVFRRIPRASVPPMLNLLVTDERRTVVLPAMGTEAERAPYQAIAERLAGTRASPASSAPASTPGGVPTTEVLRGDAFSADRAGGSLLILGGPAMNPATAWAERACGDRVHFGPDRFTVDGQTYEGAGMVLLVSCRHPAGEGRVVTVFYGLSPAAAAKVGRLLFFYGWQSYLVFRDGAVVARGDFDVPGMNLEVRFDGR